MEDSALKNRLDGLPVVRTAEELEALLAPWFAQRVAEGVEQASNLSPSAEPLSEPATPSSTSSPASGPAWIQLSPPLLPAAFLLERARLHEGPIHGVARALEILCEALATGCAETLWKGYLALRLEVDPPKAIPGRLLQPLSVQARTAFYVLKDASYSDTFANPSHLSPHSSTLPCIETLPDDDDDV